MDALNWHRQMMRDAPPLPEPLTRAALRALNDPASNEYATRVRTALRGQVLPSPIHDQLAQQLTATLESVMLEPLGARTILSLSAPFATGKSTLVKTWAQALHRKWVPAGAVPDELPRWHPKPGHEATAVPISYVTLLANSTGVELYAQQLAFAGWAPGRSVREVVQQAILALRSHGTRLVIIDDAHFLRTTSKSGRATLDAIKHLNTELGELGGALMLVGAELTSGDVLDDAQIRGRLAPHAFEPYEIDTDDGRRAWQSFLKRCEAVLLPYLPHNAPGDLATKHSTFLWVRTQGVIGDAARLLVEATAQSLRERKALDRQTLAGIRLSQRAHDGEQALRRIPKRPTSRTKVAG